MLDYLLKSGGCLLVLHLFYVLFLEKENMHVYKRIYLLSIIVVSFIIPLVTFTNYVDVVEQIQPMFSSGVVTESPIIEEAEQQNYVPIILWSIYSLGVLLFGLKFIKNSCEIVNKIKSNPKEKKGETTAVLLKEDIVPHTFFNFIFFNKQQFISHQIPEEVILHEETHARQKHSIDVLLLEFLQVIFWFNPVLYFLNKSVKLNHEFLADQAVLNNGANEKTYQHTLLAFSSNTYQLPLANAINYSSIKKRFTVMKTQTSKKKIWIRSFILLPVLALLLFSFSTTIQQEKATPQQVAEYNTLARKYNKQPKKGMVVKLKDVKRLEYLYKLMTSSQKKKADKYPSFPPRPEVIEIVNYPKSNIPPPPAPVKIIEVKSNIKSKVPITPVPVKVIEVKNDTKPPLAPIPVKIIEVESNISPSLPKNANYVLDNKKVSYDEASKIKDNEIKSVDIVTKDKNGNKLGKSVIYIYKKKPKKIVDEAEENVFRNYLGEIVRQTEWNYFVDNKKVTHKEFQAIDVKDIKSANVVKKDNKGNNLKVPSYYVFTKVGDQRPITLVNGKTSCEGCVLELTKEKLAAIVLSINKGEIVHFNIKFPKKPTVRVKNSSVLNKEAKRFLATAEVGQMVQIFGLKSSAFKNYSAPVIFRIIE